MWEDEERVAGACMSGMVLPLTVLCFGVEAILIGRDWEQWLTLRYRTCIGHHLLPMSSFGGAMCALALTPREGFPDPLPPSEGLG